MSSEVTTYHHGVEWEEANGVSQACCVHGTIYIAGQFSHDMSGAFLGEGNIEVQTQQTLSNLDRVLAGFNVTRDNLTEVIIYLTNPKAHFEGCMAVWKKYIGKHRPAGTLLGVTALAFPHQLVEIRAVAHKP
jgi:2-iminobutanoate/2-iminopropanoate deaminase